MTCLTLPVCVSYGDERLDDLLRVTKIDGIKVKARLAAGSL